MQVLRIGKLRSVGFERGTGNGSRLLCKRTQKDPEVQPLSKTAILDSLGHLPACSNNQLYTKTCIKTKTKKDNKTKKQR